MKFILNISRHIVSKRNGMANKNSLTSRKRKFKSEMLLFKMGACHQLFKFNFACFTKVGLTFETVELCA